MDLDFWRNRFGFMVELIWISGGMDLDFCWNRFGFLVEWIWISGGQGIGNILLVIAQFPQNDIDKDCMFSNDYEDECATVCKICTRWNLHTLHYAPLHPAPLHYAPLLYAPLHYAPCTLQCRLHPAPLHHVQGGPLFLPPPKKQSHRHGLKKKTESKNSPMSGTLFFFRGWQE